MSHPRHQPQRTPRHPRRLSRPTPRRALLGAALAALTALLGTPGLVAVAPAAHAEWRTMAREHGAGLEICRVHVSGDWYRVRFRVQNPAGHAHVGVLIRTTGGETVESRSVRAGARSTSRTRTMDWHRSWVTRRHHIGYALTDADTTRGTLNRLWFREVPAC